MLKNRYVSRYRADGRIRLYPVEFVVRAFLGRYPSLRMPKGRYRGARVLDLGFGDGRNMTLLDDLRMHIHGVEISDQINAHVSRRLARLGIRANLKLGSCSALPFKDAYFDFVLACHSCYYIEPGRNFQDNVLEMARVLRRNGRLIASLPMPGSYILRGAKRLPGGCYEIRRDPYRLRNGTIFRVFTSENEIRRALKPHFHDIKVGYCNDMFWGIHQKVWTVLCVKS